MKLLTHIFIILLSLIVSSTIIAQQPTPNLCEKQLKVMTLLVSGFSYITMHGEKAAIKAFNDPNNRQFYMPKEGLYIFAMNISDKEKGVLLAQPAHPEIVGKNRYNEKDYDNKFHVREIVSAAKQGGKWITYSWHNPMHQNAIETKWTYVMPVNQNWAIGSGFYVK